MTKKITYFLSVLFVLVSCSGNKKTPEAQVPNDVLKAIVIKDGLKFCEGTVVYDSAILVSNFGTDRLDPLNTSKCGYILKYSNKKLEPFIPCDSILSAPKGMAIQDDYLYIADVGSVVVYNLKDKKAKPTVIEFPADNLYVNDIAIRDKKAYVSVTNTDKIFVLDISDPASLSKSDLKEFIDVKGPNGLIFDKKTLYIASYPASGTMTTENVIYEIKDSDDPKVEKLIIREGQYDGLAIHNSRLYFTNWNNGEVGYVDLSSKDITYLHIEGADLSGPADISILNDSL